MTKPHQHIPALIITSGGSPNAYDLVRALGRAKIFSCVMSSQRRDIAFFSRYCRQRIVLSPFRRDQYRAILDSLHRFAEQSKQRPILFYASDPELHFVSEFRDDLSKQYRFLLPNRSLLKQLFNKVSFVTFAQQYELPVPLSLCFASIEELDKRVKSISFPCIVKPAYSDDWQWETEHQKDLFGPYKKALRQFNSAEELLAFCRRLPERPSGFVIQEYVKGRDESIYSFHGYFDERSNCLGYFVGKKIRTYPMHTGGSTLVRTVDHPTLAALSIGLLERIGFQGIVKIDFKFDEKRRTFKLLEINSRYNLWQLLGAYAGVNLAEIAFRHLANEPFSKLASTANNYHLLYVKQDIRALAEGYLKVGEWNLVAYLKSLCCKKCYRVWDSRDPLPFLVSVAGFAKRNFIRIARMFFPAKFSNSDLGSEVKSSVQLAAPTK
ncbi:MAG TPA: hypothetical protein VNN76_08605 [Bacteroidota bacterium]|nr:hypothetical protein [Bacteroidota bacterium]